MTSIVAYGSCIAQGTMPNFIVERRRRNIHDPSGGSSWVALWEGFVRVGQIPVADFYYNPNTPASARIVNAVGSLQNGASALDLPLQYMGSG